MDLEKCHSKYYNFLPKSFVELICYQGWGRGLGWGGGVITWRGALTLEDGMGTCRPLDLLFQVKF